MSRYYWRRKAIVEECKSINISRLRRDDYLCGFRSGKIVWKNSSGEETSNIDLQISVDQELPEQNYARFAYAIIDRDGNKENSLDYRIQLTKTPCYFGGFRYWFICPLTVNGRYCGRRVGKLYLPPGEVYFGCRHCHNLTYRSCREHNKLMDLFRKLPYSSLNKLLKLGDPKTALLAAKASFKNSEMF